MCCKTLDQCEDVILHVALHGTGDKPSIDAERQLHAALAAKCRGKKGGCTRSGTNGGPTSSTPGTN